MEQYAHCSYTRRPPPQCLIGGPHINTLPVLAVVPNYVGYPAYPMSPTVYSNPMQFGNCSQHRPDNHPIHYCEPGFSPPASPYSMVSDRPRYPTSYSLYGSQQPYFRSPHSNLSKCFRSPRHTPDRSNLQQYSQQHQLPRLRFKANQTKQVDVCFTENQHQQQAGPSQTQKNKDFISTKPQLKLFQTNDPSNQQKLQEQQANPQEQLDDIFMTEQIEPQKDQLLSELRNSCQTIQDYIKSLTHQQILLKAQIIELQQARAQAPKAVESSLQSSVRNRGAAVLQIDGIQELVQKINYQNIKTSANQTPSWTQKRSEANIEVVESSELLQYAEENSCHIMIAKLLSINQENSSTMTQLRQQNDTMRNLISRYENQIKQLSQQLQAEMRGTHQEANQMTDPAGTNLAEPVNQIQHTYKISLPKDSPSIQDLVMHQPDQAGNSKGSLRTVSGQLQPKAEQEVQCELWSLSNIFTQQERYTYQKIDAANKKLIQTLTKQLQQSDAFLQAHKQVVTAKQQQLHQLKKSQTKNLDIIKQLTNQNKQLKKLNEKFKQCAKAVTAFRMSKSSSTPNLDDKQLVTKIVDRRVSVQIEPSPALTGTSSLVKNTSSAELEIMSLAHSTATTSQTYLNEAISYQYKSAAPIKLELFIEEESNEKILPTLILKLAEHIRQLTSENRFEALHPSHIYITGFDPARPEDFTLKFTEIDKDSKRYFLCCAPLVWNLGIITDLILHKTLFFSTPEQVISPAANYHFRQHNQYQMLEVVLCLMLDKDKDNRPTINDLYDIVSVIRASTTSI